MALEKHRVFGLDLLRSTAIFLVVISHITYLLFPETEHFILSSIRAFGAVGVDLFFVLSGFLIGGILLVNIQAGKTKFSDLLLFWKRRWLRTIPNYFVVLLLNFVLLGFLNIQFPNKTELYFVFLQNLTSSHPDFFTEAWSLSVEEYAYLFLPFILYMVLSVFPKIDKKKAFLFVTIVTIISMSFIKLHYLQTTLIHSYQEWSATYRKVVIYRIDSIYMGFLLVYFYQNFNFFFILNKVKLFVFGILLFIGIHAYVFIGSIQPEANLSFYVFFYLQMLIVSLMCLFPYVLSLKAYGSILKVITYISRRSYAIYLVNYSIVLLTIQYFIDILECTLNQKIGLCFVFIFLTIILSEILYRYVEQPILRYRNKKYPSLN